MSAATLVSFDGTERCVSSIESPTNRAELAEILRSHERVGIRGSGLSYCQAGAAEGTPSISTRGLDRILGLDEEQGTITVESGCTIGALLRHVVERGYWFPVLPGHPQITVGGCAAFNTHGKTQHDIGNFGDHIESLLLLLPDQRELRCSATENADLFDLTIGGLGLTGWIVELTIRLQPLGGTSIERRAHRAGDFVEAVEIMEERDRTGTHLYSWNDGNRRGSGFGRGVVYEETFVPTGHRGRTRFHGLAAEARGRFVPVPVWNRLTTGAVNTVYFHRESRRRPLVMPALRAAFPINGKEGYFHAFGRRGFHEYQIIIPREHWATAVDEVRAMVARHDACITLASLKLFRGERRHLWFRGDGVCLTLDGPATDPTRALFADLDEMAASLDAPVNLAKDSRIGRAAVARIFPGYQGFADALAAHDPARRVDSELRRRIGV